MRLEFVDVTITSLDGTTEVAKGSTRQVCLDGVLHLFRRTDEMADETHLGSWPLASIKKWVRT